MGGKICTYSHPHPEIFYHTVTLNPQRCTHTVNPQQCLLAV